MPFSTKIIQNKIGLKSFLKLLILFLIISFNHLAWAQVYGNGTYGKKEINFSGVHTLNVNIYSTIKVDASSEQKEGLLIKAESNLINLIEINLNNGILKIDQKEWIEPSKPIILNLFLPNLKTLVHDNHETVEILNKSE